MSVSGAVIGLRLQYALPWAQFRRTKPFAGERVPPSGRFQGYVPATGDATGGSATLVLSVPADSLSRRMYLADVISLGSTLNGVGCMVYPENPPFWSTLGGYYLPLTTGGGPGGYGVSPDIDRIRPSWFGGVPAAPGNHEIFRAIFAANVNLSDYYLFVTGWFWEMSALAYGGIPTPL